MNWARQRGMQVHGHTLCWNQGGNPDWLPSLTKNNAERALTEHIRTVMTRYKGQISSWDVVNEPLHGHNDHREDGLAPGVWLELLGPSYIDIAFHAAASADPTALRVLNIESVEQGNWASKRSQTLTLLQDLLSRKIPVQAVGLESHLRADVPVVNAARDAFIGSVRKLGLEVIITECDVDDTYVTGNEAQRKALAAATYHDYLVNVMPVAHPKTVIFWTSTDRSNWYDKSATYSPTFRRADGQRHYPGLLGGDLTPNPALASVGAALGQVG